MSLYSYNYKLLAWWKQVTIGGWGGGGITDISSGYAVMFPLNIFKTIFPSLLIRFFLPIDVKYKTS